VKYLEDFYFMKNGAIDLFCGCGGISAGLREAGLEVVAGVDINTKYIQSFAHNFPNASVITEDITKISPKDFLKNIGKKRDEIQLIAGGPPCQGFSKNVPRSRRFLADPRNMLIKSYLEYCEFIRPPILMMENVAEMKNGFDMAYTEEIEERLTQLGYSVKHVVLNAADYGVPQRRKRAFFLATLSRSGVVIPVPTHSKESSDIDLFGEGQGHVKVWEAISDLPSLLHGEGSDITEYLNSPNNNFQTLMRKDLKVVRNHVARKLQPKMYERMASLKPGEGNKELPEHLKTKGGYSGAYGRLTKDMVAPTITRWVFHPGSGRWGHPVDIRTITIRETARIQSFYDSFEFVGSYVDQAGQLGNAVPPLLAEVVARSLIETLR
jgi:DNA (cytosine-5)-methyltransferase 1